MIRCGLCKTQKLMNYLSKQSESGAPECGDSAAGGETPEAEQEEKKPTSEHEDNNDQEQ